MGDLKIIRADHLGSLSVTNWGRIMDRYLVDEPHNAFGLMDACTRVFWHSEKQSYSDYTNNSLATDGMLEYAAKLN